MAQSLREKIKIFASFGIDCIIVPFTKKLIFLLRVFLRIKRVSSCALVTRSPQAVLALAQDALYMLFRVAQIKFCLPVILNTFFRILYNFSIGRFVNFKDW